MGLMLPVRGPGGPGRLLESPRHGRADAKPARVAAARGGGHPPRRAGARRRPLRGRPGVARGRPRGARAGAAAADDAPARPGSARPRARADLMPRVPASARADTVEPSVAATGTADHLAWETRQRRPAAIAAMVGAVLTLVGAIYGGIVFSDVPR